MARDFKRTGREGQEGLRIIDEALGIHVARPVARIISETLPGLSKALSGVLGGVAFGTFGVAIFEAAEHIGKKMDEAKQHQQAYNDELQKSKTLAAEFALQDERDLDRINTKIATLQGDRGAEARYRTREEAAKQADELARQIRAEAEQTERLNKAAAAQSGFWYEIGAAYDQVFSSAATLNVERLGKATKAFNDELVDALRQPDSLGALADSAKRLEENLAHARDRYLDMLDANAAAAKDVRYVPSPALGGAAVPTPGAPPFSQAELDAAKRDRDAAKRLKDDSDRGQAKTDAQRQQDRLEAAAAADTARLAGIAKFQKNAEDWNRSRNEFAYGADKVFDALDEDAERRRETGFADFTKRQAGVNAAWAPYAAQPTLAPGAAESFAAERGSAPGQISAFGDDRGAQAKMIQQAFSDAIGPAGELQLKVAELKLAFGNLPESIRNSAQAQAAFNAEIEKFKAGEVEAENKLRRLQEELQKLLKHSDDAGAGWKAFMIQLQIDGSQNAMQVFTLMTQATKGAEDAAAKSMVDIVENIHGSQKKLIDELKRMWEQFFGSLTELAAKNAMEKLVAQIPGMMAKPATATAAPSGGGFWSSLFSLFGQGAGASAGGTAGFTFPAGTVADLNEYAAGGDVGPGQSFISGEAGAERVDLNPSGAKITPLGGGAAGQTTVHNYDLRGAVVTDDLVRRADAARAAAQTEDRAVSRAVTMARDSALRGRPSR